LSCGQAPARACYTHYGIGKSGRLLKLVCLEVDEKQAGSPLKSRPLSAVLGAMDGECLIEDDESGRDSARRRRLGRAVLLVVLLAGVIVLYFRVTAAQKPPERRGLKLLDTVAHVPTSSFKTFELLLPCSGTLSIEIVAEEDNYLSVFLVAPEELAKMKARQTFAHLEGFDGNLSAKYRRSARLSPGRYCLVLMDKTPGRLNASRADAQVSVRLSELK